MFVVMAFYTRHMLHERMSEHFAPAAAVVLTSFVHALKWLVIHWCKACTNLAVVTMLVTCRGQRHAQGLAQAAQTLKAFVLFAGPVCHA